jgi:hypothetical protein
MKTHHDVKARKEEVAGLEALVAAGNGLQNLNLVVAPIYFCVWGSTNAAGTRGPHGRH